jgi:ATP-dependent Lon protease
MALGGVRDEAELRGHRRTYIGAMPGNIIAGMKKAGTQNPVILLDEVDKLGRDNRGDPASALLEILDPEQNEHFVDHYLNTEFDLSEVLFFATANDLANIPGPLRDRMEIIQIPGYTTMEKVKIAENHLIPRAVQRHALEPNDFKMPTAAVQFLIRNYTREAGVRGLERELSGLCRAIAVRYAEWMGANGNVAGSAFRAPIVNERFVEEVLGPVRYLSEAALRVTVPGVATGLAWTAVGGELLFIESTRYRGNGQLTLTGQLGSVMKESASTALSWIRANVIELGLQEPALLHDQVPLLKYYDVHLHFPAGAVPKDGPSAGVAITSALVSLFLGRRVRSDTAMTGEVTLRGKVLPVGGIKEKSLAAHREGIRRLILPKKNQKDLTDIPREIRKEMEIIFVERIEQALDAVMEGGVEFGTDESKRALPASLERTINTRAQNIAAKDFLMSNL